MKNIWWNSLDQPPANGSYVVPIILPEWLDDAWQIFHKDGHIHTVRLSFPDRTICTPQRLHLDVLGKETIEANLELFSIMKNAFPWLDKPMRIGAYSSSLAGIVARKCRPFFQRREEKEALKGSHGGRSQILGPRKGRLHLVEYDIPRAYPNSALGLLPVGTPCRIPANAKPRENSLDMLQISAVVQSDQGVLPLRHKTGIYFPKEAKIDRQWFWAEELDCALEYAETVRNFTVHKRLRFRASHILREIMQRLIRLRQENPAHEKTIKMISNRIIGTFAYTGTQSIIFYPQSSQDIKKGDWLLVPEFDLWGRTVKKKGFPHTYRPFIASCIWSRTRVQLLHALMQTFNPISVHVDCVLAENQNQYPLGTRPKKDYGIVNYEIPWRGALYVNGKREKAPGLKKPNR